VILTAAVTSTPPLMLRGKRITTRADWKSLSYESLSKAVGISSHPSRIRLGSRNVSYHEYPLAYSGWSANGFRLAGALIVTEWYVYVVTNPAGIAYTGIAKDVIARVAKHNNGRGAKFTSGRGPWQAIHVEGPFEHGEALRREMAIKRDANFKETLKAGQAKAIHVLAKGRS
jgi:putative endonuclease